MDEMEALMGFSAFGGGATSRCGQRRKPKLQQLTNLGANTPQRSPAQVVPGTELGEQLQRAGDSKRLEHGAHGVTFLLSGSKGGDAQDTFGAESLGSLLCSPRTESGDDRREAATAKLLPARCYTLLDELQQEKNKFDALDSTTFRRARSAANPYEPLGRGPFLNRSAMKVVNMDHMFQLTAVAAAAASANTSPFTFADVCGGPGGFSEYLLSRAPPRASHSAAPNQQSSIAVCGYGISLKDEICDWKLPPSSHSDPDTCESPEVDTTASFEISYGADGTGNLYELSNIRHFRDRVVLKNHPQGVHLVVADGGFQDARDQRDQEQMMTRLVVAEVLTMFSVLRAHGSFVCKTFELATPMMLQLVWLLHQCFEKITVVKPVTSRPASSERYLVALDRREHLPMDAIVSALENRLGCSEEGEGTGMELLFDGSAMSSDASFLEFMAAASDRLAQAQIDACRRILGIASGANKRKRGGERVDPALYMKCWGLRDSS